MLMPFIVKLVAGWCMLLTRWITHVERVLLHPSVRGIVRNGLAMPIIAVITEPVSLAKHT